MKREEGFYWVKSSRCKDASWDIAFWRPFFNKWVLWSKGGPGIDYGPVAKVGPPLGMKPRGFA